MTPRSICYATTIVRRMRKELEERAMKRVACWACCTTGRVHVEHVNRPFEDIPTDAVCMCCEGRGFFELRDSTINLIERAPSWFVDRQHRRRRYDRAAWAAAGGVVGPARPGAVA
jgi:predicted methyltransferase